MASNVRLGRKGLAKLVGLEDLTKATKELSDAVLKSPEAKQVNLRAANEAYRIIRAEAPDKGISRRKGWTPIRQAIEVRQKGMPAWVVLPHNKNPAGLWLEHGTAERKHKKTKKKVGRVQPTNWWSRGRNKSRGSVRRILTDGYKGVVLSVSRGG